MRATRKAGRNSSGRAARSTRRSSASRTARRAAAKRTPKRTAPKRAAAPKAAIKPVRPVKVVAAPLEPCCTGCASRLGGNCGTPSEPAGYTFCVPVLPEDRTGFPVRCADSRSCGERSGCACAASKNKESMARSLKKGPFMDGHLRVKVEATETRNEKKVVKTWSRRSTMCRI